MTTPRENLEARRAARAEYAQLQIQLRKARRDVLIGCCLVCLLMEFMAKAAGAWLGRDSRTPRGRFTTGSPDSGHAEAADSVGAMVESGHFQGAGWRRGDDR